jgi:hypothetical protein
MKQNVKYTLNSVSLCVNMFQQGLCQGLDAATQVTSLKASVEGEIKMIASVENYTDTLTNLILYSQSFQTIDSLNGHLLTLSTALHSGDASS